MTLSGLLSQFAGAGCVRVFAKPLSPNDNSKNQVYFGLGFQALNILPNEGIAPDSSRKNSKFKAQLKFDWLLPNGALAPAPGAQLILYPQYPEVRFSGFLRGCAQGPRELMASRERDRVLFLGVTGDRRIIGVVVSGKSPMAAELRATRKGPMLGVFHELSLPNQVAPSAARARLLAELARISRLGWIASKQLGSDGRLSPCNAPQCGGFTLEAELGIRKNSFTDPDFLGWEVKQHGVRSFASIETGNITLLTPEPTGGFYKERGVTEFIRRFGYQDRRGRADRMNFGGVHRVGAFHPVTGLALVVSGYDAEGGRILDVSGHIALATKSGEIAAKWAFSGLLEHWSRKHARAVYVPSRCEKAPVRQYCYGNRVRLAERTDSLRLLQALSAGVVFYDPGIKLEDASGDNPRSKRRSQFRIASRAICHLYESLESVEL